MKKLTGLLSIFILLMASCKKENNTATVLNVPIPPADITLATGTFVSSAHPSSGTIKVIQDASNKRFLVFENFKTDGGPDLRVWLSPNNTANPYQEIGLLKATTGNFYYEMDASFNYTANNRVLIWCKQFAVLFGYAVLQ